MIRGGMEYLSAQYICVDKCGSKRSAKGSGIAGHLIHRGAVPLPLKGKDNSAVYVKARLSLSNATLLNPSHHTMPPEKAPDIASIASISER